MMSQRLALALWGVAAASAAIQPSLLFSDNMVLASSATQPAVIFGSADPAERGTNAVTCHHCLSARCEMLLVHNNVPSAVFIRAGAALVLTSLPRRKTSAVALDDSRPGMSRLTAVADAAGRWQISLKPHVRIKGEPSFNLTLGSDSAVSHVASNVAYGDVLLCSG
jgi:hypothetical protein